MGTVRHNTADTADLTVTQSEYEGIAHHVLSNIGQLDVAQTWTAQQIFNALKLGGNLDASGQRIKFTTHDFWQRGTAENANSLAVVPSAVNTKLFLALAPSGTGAGGELDIFGTSDLDTNYQVLALRYVSGNNQFRIANDFGGTEVAKDLSFNAWLNIQLNNIPLIGAKLGGALDANAQNITSVNSLSFGTDTNIRFIVGSRTGEVGFIASADGTTARSITFYTQSGLLAGIGASSKRLDIGGGLATSVATWSSVTHVGFIAGGLVNIASNNIQFDNNLGRLAWKDTLGVARDFIYLDSSNLLRFLDSAGGSVLSLSSSSITQDAGHTYIGLKLGGSLAGNGNNIDELADLTFNGGATRSINFNSGTNSLQIRIGNAIPTLVTRLAISGGATSIATWSSIIHSGLVLGSSLDANLNNLGNIRSLVIGSTASSSANNIEFRAGATLTGSQAQIGAEADGGGLLFNVASGKTFVFEVNAMTKFIIDSNGNAILRTTAGAPSDTPANGALMYDTTNNRLYVYNGGWKSVALA